jgi:glycosyltransferase involved in cell wall biosynthesis
LTELKKSKILFFTKYTSEGPSSRYRSYQYFPFLTSEFDIIYYPLFDDVLSKKGGINFSFKVVLSYFKRLAQICTKLFSTDLIVIEYELFPYTPPVFEYLLYLFNRKFILDFDDAIFHNYDNSGNIFVRAILKNKISFISRKSNAVIAGSTYLSDYFRQFNSNVVQIPTSICFSNYINKINYQANPNKFIIGWLGSKSTSKNLVNLLPAFHQLSSQFSSLSFLFCGFDMNLKHLFKDVNNLEFMDWSPDQEFIFLNSIDIGIMPLDDNLFNKGKCGFKLIQYMAMGKMTISTPLLSNIEINHDNNNLFASKNLEWAENISFLLHNRSLINEIGTKNIKIVEKFYSCESNYLKYTEIFKSII